MSKQTESETEEKQKGTGKKKHRFLLQFFLRTVVLLGGSYLLFTCVLLVHRNTGNQMSPFIRDGDLCIFYRTEGIYLNEVVLYVGADGKNRLGRVVAVPGQEVNFPEEGGYTIDGYQPSEENPYETYQSAQEQIQYPIRLGETTNEYFIMNDFRSITSDSREYGPVSKDRIKGKLLFLLRRRNF